MIKITELASLCVETLDRQQAYFRSRDPETFRECRALEKRLRAAATAALDDRPTLEFTDEKKLEDCLSIIDSLRVEINDLRSTIERLTDRWPTGNADSGPMLCAHSDGTWWLETLDGDRWRRCPSGPYPSRSAAVVAACDLGPAGNSFQEKIV